MNQGQNLFGSTRLSDESQFGRAGQVKRIPYVCWCQVAERTNANKIGENRLRESEPRSKFVWIHKAEGNDAHVWLGSQGGGKRILCKHWCREAKGK